MKKFLSMSPIVLMMLVLLLIVAVYGVAYFLPAQEQMAVLRNEITLYDAESRIFQEYLVDASPLENEIQAAKDEIDRIHAEGYVNESTVSFEINEALRECHVSLTAISLGNVTTYEDFRALPINLSVSGPREHVTNLVRYFEDNEEGSYLVRGVQMTMAGEEVTASLVIYLLTPNK